MYYHPVVHFLGVSSVPGDEPLLPCLLRHAEHHHHQLRPQQGPWQPTLLLLTKLVIFITSQNFCCACLSIHPQQQSSLLEIKVLFNSELERFKIIMIYDIRSESTFAHMYCIPIHKCVIIVKLGMIRKLPYRSYLQS